MLIPTRSKSKLPKTLTWPLGAAAISDGLADAPHATEFELTFYGEPVWPMSEFQRLLREELPYKILVASFHPASKPVYGGPEFMIKSGWYKAKWGLTLYPVSRLHRHAASKLLREYGLPAVVDCHHKPAGKLMRIRSH